MKQFKPIYCNFHESDNISIIGFNGWKNEHCEEWQGIHVDITDTADGLLYVVRLDWSDSETLDDCQTLGVYSESEIVRAWSEIKSHIDKQESFSMPVFDNYKSQAVAVSRAYTLVTDCANITENAFVFCERILEELQTYFATADGNPYQLQKLTSDLKRSKSHVERFFDHTQELETDAKDLIQAIEVAISALELNDPETESPKVEKIDGKRAKSPQKATETFDDYIDLPY